MLYPQTLAEPLTAVLTHLTKGCFLTPLHGGPCLGKTFPSKGNNVFSDPRQERHLATWDRPSPPPPQKRCSAVKTQAQLLPPEQMGFPPETKHSWTDCADFRPPEDLTGSILTREVRARPREREQTVRHKYLVRPAQLGTSATEQKCTAAAPLCGAE